MKKLLGWLLTLALIAGVFWKADTILEAAGQPELAKQAATLRDDLLTRITGKDSDVVKEQLAAKAGRLKEGVADALSNFKDSMGFEPDELANRAAATFKKAAGSVPEDFAVYFEALKAQGEKTASSVTKYALEFSDHYSDEIAPELVGYWNEQIASGKLAQDKLEQTKQALAKIRAKMQPLLTDHLRVLVRLEQKLEKAEDGQAKEEIKKDMAEVEADIQRAFPGVPEDEQVLDAKKKASERLSIHLKTAKQATTADGPLEAAATTRIARAAPDAPSAAESQAAETSATVTPPAGSKDPKANESKLRSGVKPWLGTKYKMGTKTRGKTTDCSGFVGGVMNDTFKLALPRTSRLQFKFGERVKRNDLRPGDLVFFDMKKRKRIDHVGVYVGKDQDGVEQFAHASFSKGVRYDNMAGYYKRYYWGAARVLDY